MNFIVVLASIFSFGIVVSIVIEIGIHFSFVFIVNAAPPDLPFGTLQFSQVSRLRRDLF
jgi:hypothetical protein